VKYDERGANGERQDHASGDLIERGVNIFEGIIAEAEANDVQTNHGNETVDGLLVEVQRNFEQTTGMASKEE